MTEELRQTAMAGLMAGDVRPLAPYLRSFDDGVLSLAAALIDGTGPVEGYRIVIENGQVAQKMRKLGKLDKVGLFISERVLSDRNVEAAIVAAQAKCGVSRGYAYEAWKHWKQLSQSVADELRDAVGPDEWGRIVEAVLLRGETEPLDRAIEAAAERR